MNEEQRVASFPSSRRPGPDAQQRSEVLKERVYVTFTALVVTIAFERDAGHATVAGIAFTLLLTVLGTLLAVFVAPMAILGLSALGAIDVASALRAIAVALVATLVVVALFAVRRLRVKPWLKILVLAIMAALGLAVLAVELAIH